MTRKRYNIAIIGGGTAGAASALLLTRAGHHVTLFERVAEPGAVGAGILLQPAGMEVLKALGVQDEVLAHGARNTRLHGTSHRGRTVLDVRYSDWNNSAFGLGLHRGVLFSVLWNALHTAGVHVRHGTEVTRLSQSADRVELFQDDALLGTFDCAVIADGTRSQLRHQLSIPHQVRSYPWGALWAVVPDDGLTPGILRQWFRHAKEMLGVMPTGFAYRQTGAPVVSLFWSLRADRLEEWRAAGLDAWKEKVLALAPVAPILDHIASADQLTYASYADVQMPYWHQGRAVCLGDCAHATSPQLGQGANLALVDAMTLARCFSTNIGIPETLALYSSKRTSHLRYYQGASKFLTPFFQSDSRIAGVLRDTFLGPLCRAPLAKRQMARTLSGTKTGWLFGALPTSASPATVLPARMPAPPDSPTAQ